MVDHERDFVGVCRVPPRMRIVDVATGEQFRFAALDRNGPKLPAVNPFAELVGDAFSVR